MRLSLSTWKKSDGSSSDSGNAADEKAGGGMRSRAMVLVAVLGLGALGYKMFWPDEAPLKAAAATTGAKSSAAQKNAAKGNAKSPAQAAGSNARNTNALPIGKSKSNNAAAAAASGLGMSSGNDTDLPTRDEMSRPRPARPMPATKPAPNPADALLGPTFIDETNGFAMRFPIGWAMRSFSGEPWVLDCGDGRVGLISIGFSAFPNDFTADNIPPEWVARRIKKRNDTILHSQGYAMIAGKKALWSKSTGPLPLSSGSPKMTRVNYIIPLNDGRVMELRIAATPDTFDQLMPTMRASVESFRLIPRANSTTTK